MSATVTFVAARDRDVGDLADSYGDILRRHGFSVRTGPVAGADRVPPDDRRPWVAVVLLRGDDLDVRALRNIGGQDLVILVAIEGREGDAAMVLESGADDCFIHPVAPPELVARIRARLRRRRLDALPT